MSEDIKHYKKGYELLLDPALNKSTAYTEEERDENRLRGLLPPKRFPIEEQKKRVLSNLRRKESDIEKYIFLQGLHDRNETLFYSTVIDNIVEIMPLIYTPTVGAACSKFADIFRRPRGLYITANDRGRVRDILQNWPRSDVRVIVITDGERILGLGDLGANGMGIPIGKLSLYVACAGIDPSYCLPIMMDVGTNNHQLRENSLYLGLNQDRVGGDAYDELVDEIITEVQQVYPEALIQFEDFLTPNAYKLLHRYEDKVLCFNDDIQGTAAVALAGIIAATRISGTALKDQKILFLGAGSAATGIGGMVEEALVKEGLSENEARERLWFCNSRGLLTSNSEKIEDHNRRYAHEHDPLSMLEAIETLKPTALIGATGHAGIINERALKLMASINERPVIFALSNPTSKAECSAQEAYDWTDGKAVFASGSPFPPVEFDGNLYRPGQGNNAYIFPGIGLGAIACKASRITTDMFLASVHALAETVSESDLEAGSIYPPLTDIRAVSLDLAVAVAEQAVADGVAGVESDDWRSTIRAMMYEATY